MNAQSKIEAVGLSLLRQPFKSHQISKLPKPLKKDAPKGKCNECGGYHGLPAIHLDYVGHAALTDRLLDTDPHWTWEPVGFDPNTGLPARDQNGGLWIKLTVCGVTRFGYGAADGKQGGDAVKEIIGDALRNAAMRFGAALDLWHKGDLHVEDEEPANPKTGETPPEKRVPLDGPYTSKTALWAAVKAFDRTVRGIGDHAELIAFLDTQDAKDLIEQCKRDAPGLWSEGIPDVPEFVPLEILVAQQKRDLEQSDNIHNILHAG